MSRQQFIQVLLPLRLDWVPVYGGPADLHTGQAVNVIFSGRQYTGIVWKTGLTPDMDTSRIKDIISVESGVPAVSTEELKLWEFVSGYYLCSIGEVFKTAYPKLKISSEKSAARALERLKKRLADTEASLAGKHKENVMERLRALRLDLLEKIAAAEPAADRVPTRTGIRADKPLLAEGHGRYGLYAEAIRRTLEDGGQVLLLTPEIAFCDTMEQLLRDEFGNFIHVCNSSRTAAQRQHIADTLRRGSPAIVLGTRSAVFLPFSRLGLIIIDEEQDSSYKQDEPAPRYNARDTAVYLAGIHGAEVILGSASPSLETIYNCRTGKYRLMKLSGIHGAETVIIDIDAERRKNGMSGPLSRKLIDAIRGTEGRVVLIRTWEHTEDIVRQAEELFPGQDIEVMTFAELKHSPLHSPISTVAVLHADALVSRDDFRSDEKAVQAVNLLRGIAGRVIIQTLVPSRFDGSRSTEQLLEERREFGFPPFTRLVEIRKRGSGETIRQYFLKRDASLAAVKGRIVAELPQDTYVDVDP